MSQKIVAMIPARLGSTRLKMKNLALLNGRPMISYAINAAKESGVFDKVIVNSENDVFSLIADRYGCDFYLRPLDLGSSTTKSDSVVADFMDSHPEADIVVWVNSISPLQTSDDIRNTVEYFLERNLDSLITVENKQVHCLYNNEPVNYQKDSVFAQTQDLVPVQPFVYSIMMWKRPVFLKEYREKGHALFCGKFGTYPVRKGADLIVKTEEDLLYIEAMMRAQEAIKGRQLEYDVLAPISSQ